MAVSGDYDTRDAGQDFLDRSYLTYIVPSTTNFKLEKALGDTADQYQALFDAIEQREWLFFGMRLE